MNLTKNVFKIGKIKKETDKTKETFNEVLEREKINIRKNFFKKN